MVSDTFSFQLSYRKEENGSWFPLETVVKKAGGGSGTTSFRTECGINEVMYLAYDLIGKEKNDLLNLKKNKKFPRMYRYIEDYII